LKEAEMSHLLKLRKGWENERLAEYLLSRFSFVAQPNSIADDLGSDFFCTMFEIEGEPGMQSVSPRSSFAIQVKSSQSDVPMDNKIAYLSRLELPFFVGVVSQSPPSMTIYSAEFLPLLFSQEGMPKRLSLSLVAESHFDLNTYYERVADSAFKLRCPLVISLDIADEPLALRKAVDSLSTVCARARGNIATRMQEEHIYDFDGGGRCVIMAGSGSARFFRGNFLKRLGEVFYNLDWIAGNSSLSDALAAEFRVFESLYLDLEKLSADGPLPDYVSLPYLKLKAKFGDH
jgi:hypothetical protein